MSAADKAKAVKDAAPADVTAKLSDLRTHLDKARRKAIFLDAKAEDLKREEPALKAENQKLRKSIDEHPIKRYKAFVNDRAALYGGLKLRHEAFTFGASIQAQDLRTAPLEHVTEYASGWPQFAEEAKASIAKLNDESTFLKEEGADTAMDSACQGLLDDTQKLYDEHSAKWVREGKRRETYGSALQEFKDDQAKLVQWCRAQTANLNNLEDPENVQEFCTSFHTNLSTMESNFIVLMEISERLLPNKAVESSLLEVAEAWIGLEVSAFEKLRGTLMELQAKSGLESEARAWVEYSGRFKQFLADAEVLLNQPTDDESSDVMKTAKASCRQLQQDQDAHLLIVEHVSDFTLREECVKDHYNAVRKTIFSKVTMLTQSFPSQYTFARKQEYSDHMAQLNDWIECKSQSAAWKLMLQRVDRMKTLIAESELTRAEEVEAN